MKRYFPWLVLVLAASWLAANWWPTRTAPGDLKLDRFGKTPVLVGGRVKPLDTVARNSLLIIHGRQELNLDDGRHLRAMQWLTDVLFNARVADQYPVFVVQNAEVLGLFGWQQSDRKYFRFADFSPFLKQIDEQGQQSDKLESVQRSAYQNAILNLRNALVLYQRLKNSIQPEDQQNFAAQLEAYRASVPRGRSRGPATGGRTQLRQSEARRCRGIDSTLRAGLGNGLRSSGASAQAGRTVALGRATVCCIRSQRDRSTRS